MISHGVVDGAAGAVVVILAAGKGTRMKSDLPKVMHPLAGKPLLWHVLRCAEALEPAEVVVVVGPDMPQVEALAKGYHPMVRTVVQQEQLGTGHAVQTAWQGVEQQQAAVLVLYGDSPLLTAPLAAAALQATQEAAMCVVGMRVEHPTGYGRLVQDKQDKLVAIVEEKDATATERQIHLCNSGIMAFAGGVLPRLMGGFSNQNASGEYYLTEAVALARAQGLEAAVVEGETEQLLGANTRVELAQLEALLQQRLRNEAMLAGVTMVAPETVFLAADVVLERDVVLQPFVTLGEQVHVERGVEIRSFSHLQQCRVGAGSVVGPYARLRPGTVLQGQNHVGNFVELKNAELGVGSKVNHLSYLGDATVGAASNVGAGTITCNYDGVHKSRTVIGDGCFIGSNSALVAPVVIGDGALVAAGSVITQDVPEDALAVARGVQQVKPGRGMRSRQKTTAA